MLREVRVSRRKTRVVSDPREIAQLVLDTPGLADKLADACAAVVCDADEAAAVRATVHRTLVDIARQGRELDAELAKLDAELAKVDVMRTAFKAHFDVSAGADDTRLDAPGSGSTRAPAEPLPPMRVQLERAKADARQRRAELGLPPLADDEVEQPRPKSKRT